jgi:hypothetical protein
MKTLKLFFFIVFATAITTNAQITKGNWMVGGEASFVSSESEFETNGNKNSSETSYIRVTPGFGYFFIDKLVGGAELQFIFVDPGKNFSSQNYSFGPYLRYYFLKPAKKVNLFSQVGYDFGVGKNGLDTKTNTSGYSLKAGTVLFFNNSVGIEFSLNYKNSVSKHNNETENTNNQFFAGIGFQIHLEK